MRDHEVEAGIAQSTVLVAVTQRHLAQAEVSVPKAVPAEIRPCHTIQGDVAQRHLIAAQVRHTVILSEGVAYLPAPDKTDETAAYFYFGWAAVEGGWRIRRQVIATLECEDARGSGDFATAWQARATLEYT